ncbi:hypothetical protein PN836_012070 [Ningiella sp. W23]|uniref:hypothetical protein n=1 Tax=Ningiella sp. W23 TaxID=3023715 RepID=UPI0037569ED6
MIVNADIILVSGEDPAEFSLAKRTSVTIHNACKDVDGNPVATTLSCEPGLFAPPDNFPMLIDADETITVQVLDGDKDYYYTDTSVAELGTRGGRIRV